MKENVDANKGRMDFANNSHFLGNTDVPMCPLTSSPTAAPPAPPFSCRGIFLHYASASEVNLSNFLHRSYLFKC